MVRVINKDEIANEPQLIQKLKSSVFIYPTDTVYGIGCDATNEIMVDKVRRIKRQYTQPFSIITPDRTTVEVNCVVDENVKGWLDKLPGPYTLILQLKNKFFANNVNLGSETIGIRIPKNWFLSVVKKMNIPVVTTSANISGQEFMTSLDDIHPDVKRRVDFIIYDGPLNGRPSTLVNLSKPALEIRQR